MAEDDKKEEIVRSEGEEVVELKEEEKTVYKFTVNFQIRKFK